MARRSEELRRRAVECAELAGKASDRGIRLEFLTMAARFRELAAHIDAKAESIAETARAREEQAAAAFAATKPARRKS